MTDESLNSSKCSFYKCSKVATKKLCNKIYGLNESDSVSEEIISAVHHLLHSKNFFNDYSEVKNLPFDDDWKKENISNRLQEFM